LRLIDLPLSVPANLLHLLPRRIYESTCVIQPFGIGVFGLLIIRIPNREAAYWAGGWPGSKPWGGPMGLPQAQNRASDN
jgi:hypothetical protein